ncbi:hypothetical protein GQ53DRAFT_708567 [Thozetella sp. PMI_491]|nr:hypothetical protein GQ53DRAFT_708567 [Thozetella sp. PMI_491]
MSERIEDSSPVVRASLRDSVAPRGVPEAIRARLPACQRCRRLRRKCDTLLPQCRTCQKADEECTFIDPGSDRKVSREHVQSLVARLEHLRLLQDERTKKTESALESLGGGNASVPSSIAIAPGPPGPSFSFDVLIPAASDSTKLRYWGFSSVFALSAQVVQHAYLKGFVPEVETASRSELRESPEQDVFLRRIEPAPVTDVQSLIELYMRTSNAVYRFLDETTIPLDLQTYLALRDRPGFSAKDLRRDDAHRFFRISLVCAISCATEARHRPSRTAESLAYYDDALGCVEEVTSEASPASLQALLLLIIFCLFYPRKGEIWRLLDYACRLAIELGYHKEEDLVDHSTSPASVYQQPLPAIDEDMLRRQMLRRSTFWALYALERITGQLFGRGSDLPETIITTEYPNALPAYTTPDSDGYSVSGDTTVQAAAFAHHYRLVYLRSEIFRTVYMPAVTPDLAYSMPWLREQYAAISEWRAEVPVPDNFAGYATLTCVQGYNQTICFLFQPLLLRALLATRVSSTERAEPCDFVIVADSYEAACALLRAYERLLKAPHGSVLGSYPLTLISAHYIWMATSTLVGHILLALDGRVRTVWRFRHWYEGGDSGEEVEPRNVIDYASFLDMSRLSSWLLHWCAERWPGMRGLLDVFEELLSRLARELVRRGMAA